MGTHAFGFGSGYTWPPKAGYAHAGRQQEIHSERDRRLEKARRQRQLRRLQATEETRLLLPVAGS